MKILLDANISWKLVNTLKPIFGECAHVDLIGLNVPAVDIEIWNYALENEYIIITKDNDFLDLLELMKKMKPMIEDLEKNEYGLLEIV